MISLRSCSKNLINTNYLNQNEKFNKKLFKALTQPYSNSHNKYNFQSFAESKSCPFMKHENKNGQNQSLSLKTSYHIHQPFPQIKKFNFVNKFKSFFNFLTKKNLESTDQLKYSQIPNASTVFPVLTSILRLTYNGGVSQLHKHCDKLHKKFGSIYKERLGPIEALFIADDQLIKQVFKQEDHMPVHMIPEPWIIYNEVKKVQRGIFFLNGESWKKQRTCLNGLFLKKGALSDYMSFFTNVIDDMLYSWEESLDDKNSLIIPELEKQLYSWSIESLGTVIFGRRLGCIPEYLKMNKNPKQDREQQFENHHKISKMQEEFNSAVRQIFIETGKMQLLPAKLAYKFNLPVWRRFVEANNKALEIAKNYVEENIQEHEKNANSDKQEIGILNQLLKYPSLKGPQLNNIITDLFLAATDTTSHSTQWALYLIAKNPECQEKILAELKSVLKEGEQLGEKHLKSLDYVRGVIKETLRLYPVAPFISRIFSKDINVGGYQIPKNKLVCFSLYTIGRMEKHYQDANKFLPERWIRNEKRKKVNSYAYIPFALGSRSCIGKKVAEAQMTFFICKFVSKFKIDLANDEEIDIKLRMITTPEKPISIRLIKR